MYRFIVIVIVSVFTFCGCASTQIKYGMPKCVPAWVKTLQSDGHIRIGIGHGQSLEEADGEALSAISRELRVAVSSTFESKTIESKNEVSRLRSKDLRVATGNRQLKRARRIRHIVCESIHYVAMEIDVRPDAIIFAEQIRKSFGANEIPKYVRFTGSSSLVNGMVLKELTALLSSPYGIGTHELPVNVTRKNGEWVFSAGNYSMTGVDLSGLFEFDTVVTGGLDFFMEDFAGNRFGTRLNSGDTYGFVISGPIQNGYISIFDVYADGRVSVIVENQSMDKSRLRIPEEGAVFKSIRLESEESAVDEYIMVWTQEKADHVKFMSAAEGDGLVSGERSYSVNYLAEYLDSLPNSSIVSLLRVETR